MTKTYPHKRYAGIVATLCASAVVLLAAPWKSSAASPEIRYAALYVEDMQRPAGTDCTLPYEDRNFRCNTIVGAKDAALAFHNQLSTIGTQEFVDHTKDAPGILGLEWGFKDSAGNNRYWVAENQIENTDVTLAIAHSGSWCYGASQAVPARCQHLVVPGKPTCCGASLSGYPLSYTYDGNQLGAEAFSKNMYLGNEGRGLGVLSMWGCALLAPVKGAKGFQPAGWGEKYLYDVGEDLIPRWSPALKGGLRMVTGTWNNAAFGDMKKFGNNYGSYLKAGKTFSDAWRTAMFDANGTSDPAVVATGTGDTTAKAQTDCLRRLDNMTLANLRTSAFPRLAESGTPPINYYCIRGWW